MVPLRRCPRVVASARECGVRSVGSGVARLSGCQVVRPSGDQVAQARAKREEGRMEKGEAEEKKEVEVR
jgi:hypothetical protein